MEYKVVSYIQDSFMEYEGEHSLVLFAFGCNFRCSYCYNLEKVTDPKQIISTAGDIIDKKITPIHTAVVFLGGEPFFQPNLKEVLRKVKKLGLKTKVFTNGFYTVALEEAAKEGLIDAISIDYKTVHNVEVLGVSWGEGLNSWEYNNKLSKAIEISKLYIGEVELRFTKYKGISKSEEKAVEEVMKGYNVRYIIQNDFRDSIPKNI